MSKCEASILVTAIEDFYEGKKTQVPDDVKLFMEQVKSSFPEAFSTTSKVEADVNSLLGKLVQKTSSGGSLLDKAVGNSAKVSFSVQHRPKGSVGTAVERAKEIVSGISEEAKKLVGGKVKFVDGRFIAGLLAYSPDTVNLGTRTLQEMKEDFKFSMIGQHARSVRQRKFTDAVDLAAEGKTVEGTGWRLDVDGKWKYTLSTSPELNIRARGLEVGAYRLGDIVKYKELFDEYPYMETLPVIVHESSGAYSAESGSNDIAAGINVYLDKVLETDWLRDDIDEEKSDARLLEVLGHEVQHNIQFIESMDSGDNLDSVNTKRVAEVKKDYGVLVEALKELEKNHPSTYASFITSVKTLTDIKDTDLGKELINYTNGVGDKEEFVTRLTDRLKIMYASNFDITTEHDSWATFEVYLEGMGEVEARQAGVQWSGRPDEYPGISKTVKVNPSKYDYTGLPVVNAVQAVYIRADNNFNADQADSKTVYINVNNVTEEALPGVFFHEVGIHAFIDMLRSKGKDDKVKELLDAGTRLFYTGINSSNEKVREFFKRVEKRLGEAKALGNQEETLAYILEETVNKLKEDKLFDIRDSWKTIEGKISKSVSPLVANVITRLVALLVQYWDGIRGDSVKAKKWANRLASRVEGTDLEGFVADVGIQLDLDNLVVMAKEAVAAVNGTKDPVAVVEEMQHSSDNAMVKLYNSIISNSICR